MSKRSAEYDLDEFESQPNEVMKIASQDVAARQDGMEIEEVDVLRIPGRRQYYAFVEKLEIEYAGRRQQKVLWYHLMLECVRKDWFDKLWVFPPATNLPPEAGVLLLDVTVTALQLDRIRNKIAVPHIKEHWWVELTLTNDESVGITVVVYPIDGPDAATLGNRPNAMTVRLEEIRRIRPPSTLIDLNQYTASSGM